ncbi:HET-domain-containing protein, partial [Trametes sanguinea]
MWLLDTSTYRLRFEQDPSQVLYAILSHIWDMELNAKIKGACAYARSRGHRYIWIDTCCIDKTSSAELSEALNSMFDWYSYAEVCYVFLPDVGDNANPASPHSEFSCSLWFKRGWTLQELIVPQINVFLSRSWRMLGTKASLAKTIAETTGIDQEILLHKRPLHSISVARRMAWASNRETTRVEDEAYCLMGLFGIRMPTIYGEGRQAFIRLQEEILKRIPDQSLFAWGWRLDYLPPGHVPHMPLLQKTSEQELRASKGAYLFATTPADFSNCDQDDTLPFSAFTEHLSLPSSDP